MKLSIERISKTYFQKQAVLLVDFIKDLGRCHANQKLKNATKINSVYKAACRPHSINAWFRVMGLLQTLSSPIGKFFHQRCFCAIRTVR